MTTAQATDFLKFVDNGQFKDLFEELGWAGIGRGAKTIHVDFGEGREYEAVPVADQSGLRVWVVESERLADASEQRAIDAEVQKVSQVHLLIFTDGTNQSWRWPRHGATAATNKRLLHHHYRVGDEEMGMDLQRRLEMIELPVGKKLGILEIQELMAAAFNEEAVKRSQEASNHMEDMNQELLDCGASTETASSLLVRLLFLFFGDDTAMWKKDAFRDWVLKNTTGDNLSLKLTELFRVLCDPELDLVIGSKQAGRYKDSEFKDFRRIGGMYEEEVELPHLSETFRQQVLKASDFDWGKVNPDIFGAMFQQLVDLDELHLNGEHYTSEENIMKVLEPMFLNELRERFESNWDDRNGLISLQDEMASMQFLDPACGCGNFLIQAYKHLRGLEYEIIERLEAIERKDILEELDSYKSNRKTQRRKELEYRLQEIESGGAIHFDEGGLRKSKLNMKQFYGIEINQWPAKVASTAMLLVDHLCNQAWGNNVVRLPIEDTPEIVNRNALSFDWKDLLCDSAKTTYIFGNPPFLGQKEKTEDPQKVADMKRVWGDEYHGYLDYVTAWHHKSLDFFEGRAGEFAFVSTDSVTQGVPVAPLFRTIFRYGWKIRFAHRPFKWSSEARNPAGVICVVIGFTRDQEAKQLLWDYPDPSGASVPVKIQQQINPYLLDGPDILVLTRGTEKRLSKDLAPVQSGSKAVDWQNYTLSSSDLKLVNEDPIAAKYVRLYIGGDELINNDQRWCLWLKEASDEDIAASKLLRDRVEKVQRLRSTSKRSATLKAAETPLCFGEDRQPEGNYLGIPQTFSENRKYVTAARLDQSVIASIKLFTAEDPDGLLFGIVSSAMFLAWQKAIGGRRGTSISFANTLTWNTFPLPALNEEQRTEIIRAGKQVLEARALFPDLSLKQLYKADSMEPELVSAHEQLDLAVDRVFGADGHVHTLRERQELLFAKYEELVA